MQILIWCNAAVNPMEVERPVDETITTSEKAEVSVSIESSTVIESIEVEGATKTTQIEQTGMRQSPLLTPDGPRADNWVSCFISSFQ